MNSTQRLAAFGLLVLGACRDVAAPVAARPPIQPELLVLIADADARLVPALDADARAPMRAALTELRAALEARDVTAAQRATAVVRALVAGHQSEHASQNMIGSNGGDTPQLVGADGADLGALSLLTAAAELALGSTR